jgi:HAD superfamily hydrolase (TIGR01509 family)
VSYRAILFDLGGVLIDWDGTTPLVELSQGRLSVEQARRFWLESSWVRCLETDQCQPLEFAAGVLDELKPEPSLTPAGFLEAFQSWDKGPLPGADKILEQLGGSYTLACLSNNNRLHWSNPRLQSLLKYFRHCFVSFETGLMKPDRAAFDHVVTGIGLPPGEMLFLDDNFECVQAARKVGLPAFQARGLAGVRQVLATAGIPLEPR